MGIKQCWNCAAEIDDDESFCPKCEARQGKSFIGYLVQYVGYGTVLLIILIVGYNYIFIPLTTGSFENNNPTVAVNANNANTVENKPVTPQLTQEQKNIQTCEQIAKEYYENHKYMMNTYDCDNMAQDVWNILQSKGIPAQIVTGNLELNEQNEQYSIEKANHAWVIAYPSNNGGIALECTGGFVSYDNKYFQGFFFDDPQELRDYYEILYKLYK